MTRYEKLEAAQESYRNFDLLFGPDRSAKELLAQEISRIEQELKTVYAAQLAEAVESGHIVKVYRYVGQSGPLFAADSDDEILCLVTIVATPSGQFARFAQEYTFDDYPDFEPETFASA
jgi:hypothetical protein